MNLRNSNGISSMLTFINWNQLQSVTNLCIQSTNYDTSENVKFSIIVEVLCYCLSVKVRTILTKLKLTNLSTEYLFSSADSD